MDEEERNYCCLVLLFTRVAVERIRQHFIDSWDAVGKLRPWLDLPHNGKDLLTKFKPLTYEKVKVRSGDTSQWDLSLLVKVLLHSRPPFVTDKRFVKSLECLRDTRNTISHTPNGKIATPDYNKLWSAACNALILFGATAADFQKVKQDVKLPWNELTSLIKHYGEKDDDILHGLRTIMERMQEMKEEISDGQQEISDGQQEISDGRQEISDGRQEISDGRQEISDGQQEIKEESKEGQQEIVVKINEPKDKMDHPESSSCKKKKWEWLKSKWLKWKWNRKQGKSFKDMQQRSDYLKASIKRQTESQPKFAASHLINNARTDDIFTHIAVRHVQKSFPWVLLPKYSNRCQDIFIPDKKKYPRPKSVLVTGIAGIGKSIFCQKLVRDWADDKLFQKQSLNADYGFDFVYLLSFRNLNLIHEEELTLRDVLNRCSLLDEHSGIDEALFKYLLEHQDRVLFVLDGFDEFAQRENITSDRIEAKYPNDPHSVMPVSALLSKLMKGKIFGEAVVMVTSRPDEPKRRRLEPRGMRFNYLVRINGFSEEKVLEFILKYFKSDDKVGKNVVKHVEGIEDLLSLAHVPMFCFLICWCMEWHIKNKPHQDLFITMTELLFEFVELFLLKHHAKSTYRTDQTPEYSEFPGEISTTLEKLSKLAVETMKSKNFTFDEDDLTRYGFNADEIEDLKASGLLTSGPGIRISARKITHYFCFLHLSLHEYLAALWYVQNKQVPSEDEIDSQMVFRFIAGLCGKEKCEKLMIELIESYSKSNRYNPFNLLKLIYEYGDEKVAVKIIEMNPNSLEMPRIIFDANKFAAFSLNSISAYRQKFSKHDILMISELSLSLSLSDDNYRLVADSLNHPYCPITGIQCTLPDSVSNEKSKKLEHFLKSLTSSKITHLGFNLKNLLFQSSIKHALIDPDCKITKLTLFLRCINADSKPKQFKMFVKSLTSSKVTHLQLLIGGAPSYILPLLKNVLIDPNCKITALNLEYVTITDSESKELELFVKSLPSIKITHLQLCVVPLHILTVLKNALIDPNCKITVLLLGFVCANESKPKELELFLKSLPSSKVTHLQLVGVRLQFLPGIKNALIDPNCKITELTLQFEPLRDSKSEELELFLKSLSLSKITHLQLGGFTSHFLPGIKNALIDPNCKITVLILGFNFLDDSEPEEVELFLKSLSSSKITHLQLDHVPVHFLPVIKNALIDPNCKIKELTLKFWYLTKHDSAVELFTQEVTNSNTTIKINII